ncbi:MAG: hypothetical protein ACRCZB_05465 [Bacteroidales bacterium]
MKKETYAKPIKYFFNSFPKELTFFIDDFSSPVSKNTNVPANCKIHGNFTKTVRHFSEGKGCPLCSSNYKLAKRRHKVPKESLTGHRSEWEEFIASYINSLGFSICQSSKLLTNKKEIDIFIPSLQLGFELNGAYFHNSYKNLGNKSTKYHAEKSESALKLGINLIQLWSTTSNYKNISIINAKLGVSKKISARKMLIEECSENNANRFYSKHHYKERVIGSFVSYKLVYFGTTEMCMSFRKITETEVEIITFCSAMNTRVLGGFSKLVSHFCKKHPRVKKIIAYAPIDLSGNPYLTVFHKQGFELTKKCPQNLFYYNSNNRRSIDRERLTKQNLKKLLKDDFHISKTEEELCASKGLYRCYDSGSWKFEKTL